MKKVVLLPIFALGMGLLAVASANTFKVEMKPNTVQAAQQLVFNEDFNGTSIDATKWTNCYPGNKCDHNENNELMCYKPANTTVSNGTLKLTAKKEVNTCTNGQTYQYSSGLIQTSGKFSYKYGYAEVRAKTTKGKGFWPTFWMLPQDYSWPPELDVLEQIGSLPNVNFMSIHHKQDDGSHAYVQQTYEGPDFTAGFHVYGMAWTSDTLTYYVDGVERASYHQKYKIPNTNMYLLLNLAVGGSGPGAPDATTPFPSNFEVDYVKIWQ